MYQFYSEEEINNKISKKEMNKVDIDPITKDSVDVAVSVGGEPCEFYNADSLAELITDGKSKFGLFDNGGVLVFTTEDEKIRFNY